MLSRRDFLRGTAALALSAIAHSGCAVDYSLNDFRIFRERSKLEHLTSALTEESETINDKVRAVVEWGLKNLFHFTHEFNCSGLYDIVEGDIEGYTKLTAEQIFSERGVCCHLASVLLGSMLFSIGIGAEYLRTQEDIDSSSNGNHGVLYVPDYLHVDGEGILTRGAYFHGDDIALMAAARPEVLARGESELIHIIRPIGYEAPHYDESESGLWIYREDVPDSDENSRIKTLAVQGVIYPADSESMEAEWNRLLFVLEEFNLNRTPNEQGCFNVVGSGFEIHELNWY
jgi:hypothetical protein